jgi:hypothetical protein
MQPRATRRDDPRDRCRHKRRVGPWAMAASKREQSLDAQLGDPHPGNRNDLDGVGATSPANAWAVGLSSSGTGDVTLVPQWNDTKWKQVPSPNPGSNDILTGGARLVRQRSMGGGTFSNTAGNQALALHCC